MPPPQHPCRAVGIALVPWETLRLSNAGFSKDGRWRPFSGPPSTLCELLAELCGQGPKETPTTPAPEVLSRERTAGGPVSEQDQAGCGWGRQQPRAAWARAGKSVSLGTDFLCFKQLT